MSENETIQWMPEEMRTDLMERISKAIESIKGNSYEVNADYVNEVKKYVSCPVSSCDRKQALKLLKRFDRKDFRDFWLSPIDEYLSAVSEGTMKFFEVVYPHDQAVTYAKTLTENFSVNELARAFLYGVAHNAPEYRTALASMYYIKNLPHHDFSKKYIGTNCNGDVYSEHKCGICDYDSELSEEPKMQFWHINATMSDFYFRGSTPLAFDLNTAILFLQEYKRQPIPHTSSEDLDFFWKIIADIEKSPQNTTPSKLCDLLKHGSLSFMTKDSIASFIDMLGYLNILHTPDSFGVTEKHIPQNEQVQPKSINTYYAYPVYNWIRKYGVDYNAINKLFSRLYE